MTNLSTAQPPSKVSRDLHWRGRRLRINAQLRALVRETRLTVEDLVYPLFVVEGEGLCEPIASMPGRHRWSIDRLIEEAGRARDAGVRSVLLFGVPSEKSEDAAGAFDPGGLVPRAVRALKANVPGLAVITDVCLCSYTTHGHCGVVGIVGHTPGANGLPEDVRIDNDATLGLLRRVATVHAEAGADLVAPSGMMDGMVAAIRSELDGAGYSEIPILSYAVKYASTFYGPFREAADGAPAYGDRRTHQMDPANVREAVREARADIAEGADIVMVKPAAAYLDVVRTLRDTFPEVPLAAYNVSGEYSMVKAAAERGWIDERGAVLELLTGIKRAGADIIITYHATDVAEWLAT